MTSVIVSTALSNQMPSAGEFNTCLSVIYYRELLLYMYIYYKRDSHYYYVQSF